MNNTDRERILLLENNHINIMEKIDSILDRFDKFEEKLDKALEKKANVWVEKVWIWFFITVGAGLLTYLGTLLIKLIQL